MKAKAILAMSCIGITVCSCSLFGPRYFKPQVNYVDSWNNIESSSKLSVESQVELSVYPWWKDFKDPVLNNLVDKALANNNNIQVAIGNIVVNQGRLQKVHMNWVPKISIGGMAGFGETFNFDANSSNPNINKATSSSSSTTFNGAAVIPSYSLNIIQQIKQQEVAKASLIQARASKDALRLAVIQQVVNSYVTLKALKQQLQTQNEIVDELKELVRLAQIQQKYGYITAFEVNHYQEELIQANAQLPTLKTNITELQNALSLLTNQSVEDVIKDDQGFSNFIIPGFLKSNIPSQVLNNRPDIIQAEENLKVANANIGVAQASFFPSINLTTPLGAFNSKLTSLFNPSGDFWQVQVSAVMPILNLSINSEIKSAKGAYYSAYYNYIQTVKNSFAEVENSLSAFNNYTDSYYQAESLFAVSLSNYSMSQRNYKLGYISHPENLNYKLTMNKSAIYQIQAKLQVLQSIAKIYSAMASGYNYNNTESLVKFNDSHDI